MTWERFVGRSTLHNTSALASPRSASSRTTDLPAADRLMARLTARLLLPTPPLPLVIATTVARRVLARVCRTNDLKCEAWSTNMFMAIFLPLRFIR